jgi:hypothetical protein
MVLMMGISSNVELKQRKCGTRAEGSTVRPSAPQTPPTVLEVRGGAVAVRAVVDCEVTERQNECAKPLMRDKGHVPRL